MRTLAILTAALLFAGCIDRFSPDEPVDAATTEAPVDEAPMEEAASASTSSSSSSSQPSSSSSSSSSSTSAETHQHASTSAAPPPPEPVPVPWNLTGEARLGYVAAVGGPAEADAAASQVPSQQDADHCPDATFDLPDGGQLLTIVVTPQAASAGSAGMYRIVVTGPDGVATSMEPAVAEGQPSPDSVSYDPLVVEVPASGAWALRAEPIGPAAMQVWTVSIEAGGESIAAPTDLLVTPSCS